MNSVLTRCCRAFKAAAPGHAMGKQSKTQRHRLHKEHAAKVEKAIDIRKSRIKLGGGGAFTTVKIKRGACVGFYAGSRGVQTASRDYVVDGDSGSTRDGFDRDGRLVLADGSRVDAHGWTAEDWKPVAGARWDGVAANWTRFMNHASADHQNVALATTSETFGRSHAFYAKRDIDAGEELFFSYGATYWRDRAIVPADPE